jgi:uncharacterized ferritin-like protein (DUF455 family)
MDRHNCMEWALAALHEKDPETKAGTGQLALDQIARHGMPELGAGTPPERPGRPEKPQLCLPKDMPRRRKAQSEGGRMALLHALAHIELNAIDLAWDIIARFAPALPAEDRLEFAHDWMKVAADEGRHFLMIQKRLGEYGMRYGDLPAHDGLWESAEVTSHDVLARLAVVPLVHEARGLDVTPGMITQLRMAGDDRSAEIVQTIHDEEIAHVATGHKWFVSICTKKRLEPRAAWQKLVNDYFTGSLKKPFNDASREKAGFTSDWYEPLAQ